MIVVLAPLYAPRATWLRRRDSTIDAGVATGVAAVQCVFLWQFSHHRHRRTGAGSWRHRVEKFFGYYIVHATAPGLAQAVLPCGVRRAAVPGLRFVGVPPPARAAGAAPAGTPGGRDRRLRRCASRWRGRIHSWLGHATSFPHVILGWFLVQVARVDA
ncbi:hypothetical protein PEC18_30145 [Paucibacter sp. O1-1]|nr:hypothetical protein [Paucibacter sp. O1-1]MDA3829982.1 hypothetical protein [Paucibacter sp. O1-1]